MSIAIFALVLTAAVVARAAETPPSASDVKRAALAFDKGREAYKAQEFAEAAEYFELANSYAKSSATLRLAMTAREKAGQLERAATLAALAKVQFPDDTKLMAQADALLDRARGQLHRLMVSCSEACELLLDNKLVVGNKAKRRAIYLQPGGPYWLRASFSGDRNEEETIVASAGGRSEVSFEAPPLPEAGPVHAGDARAAVPPAQTEVGRDRGPERASSGWSPTVFWVGVGLTAAVGGVTVWSGVDTLSNPGTQRVKEECVDLGSACPVYQEGLEKQMRTNVLAGTTAGLGLATLLIGALATDWSGDEGVDHGQDAARATAPRGVAPWVQLGAEPHLGLSGAF